MELASWAVKKVTSVTVVGSSELPFQQVFGKHIGSEIKKVGLQDQQDVTRFTYSEIADL